MDEVSRYLDQVEQVLRDDPEQREGQAHFNALRALWPDVAQQIVGTELDPFNVDRRLPDYLAWVERRLGGRAAAAE